MEQSTQKKVYLPDNIIRYEVEGQQRIDWYATLSKDCCLMEALDYFGLYVTASGWIYCPGSSKYYEIPRYPSGAPIDDLFRGFGSSFKDIFNQIFECLNLPPSQRDIERANELKIEALGLIVKMDERANFIGKKL